MPERVRQEVESYLAKRARDSQAEFPLIVAISGGPDSVALAHALRFSPRHPSIVLAHVNHLLRGAQSDGDAEFVLELAQKWKVPAEQKRIDVRAEARSRKENLEAVARTLRYAWLAEAARRRQANVVVTAHTANDQAETVLHRILRGTGLKGIAGMAPRRALGIGCFLERPLLRVERSDIIAYLDHHGMSFRDDRTNRDQSRFRGRLRYELIPLLTRGYQPHLVRRLAKLANLAREEMSSSDALAQSIASFAELPRAGSKVILNLTRLIDLTPALRRVLYRWLWTRERWPQSGMDLASWERLAAMVEGGPSAWDLPGGVHARRTQRTLVLDHKHASTT